MTMKYSHRHEATGAQRRGQPQAPRETGQAFGHTRRAGAEDTGQYDSRTSARGVGEAGREVASAGNRTAPLAGLATANLRARPVMIRDPTSVASVMSCNSLRLT